ncbi:MAG: hypothetical protein AAF389_18655 [Gemmatimonadota bacterium]
MSFFKRLFGSGDAESGPDIDERLAALESEAEKAQAGYVGSAYNKAGDLALKSDLPDRAVGYYGQAIDAFLEDAQREQARSVANKIIRVRPSAIRTLCTLTWLDMAAQHRAMALLHLRDYVEAARAADQQPRAATQIYLMARVSPESEFLGAVADGLDSLDFPKRAAEVRSWIGDGAPEALAEDAALAEACLESAIRSNDRDAELLSDDEVEAGPDPAESGAGEDDENGESGDDASASSAESVPEEEAAPAEASVEEDEISETPADHGGPEDGASDDAEAEDAGVEDETADDPEETSSDKGEGGETPPAQAASSKKGKGAGKSRKKRKKKKKKR